MGSMKDLLGETPFQPPAFRLTDPPTSRAAAKARPNSRRGDRLKVLRLLARHPLGLTDFEIAEKVNRQQTSAGKRRGELRDLGLVFDSGETRPAPSGSMAIVWRITEAGIAEIYAAERDEAAN